MRTRIDFLCGGGWVQTCFKKYDKHDGFFFFKLLVLSRKVCDYSLWSQGTKQNKYCTNLRTQLIPRPSSFANSKLTLPESLILCLWMVANTSLLSMIYLDCSIAYIFDACKIENGDEPKLEAIPTTNSWDNWQNCRSIANPKNSTLIVSSNILNSQSFHPLLPLQLSISTLLS